MTPSQVPPGARGRVFRLGLKRGGGGLGRRHVAWVCFSLCFCWFCVVFLLVFVGFVLVFVGFVLVFCWFLLVLCWFLLVFVDFSPSKVGLLGI